MKRDPVNSSHVKSIGHDPATERLEVEFHGGQVYTHHGVDAEDVEALKNAPSVGKHYAQNFRGNYAPKKH